MKESDIRHGPWRVRRILKAEIRGEGSLGTRDNELTACCWWAKYLASTLQLCIEELRVGRLERSTEADIAFMFNLSKYETQFACPEYTPYLICIEGNLCIQI